MTTNVLPKQEADPARGVAISQVTAVEQARAIAEVQAAVTVAQNCPRDTGVAWAEMKASCGRLGLASRAFYSVPNRGTGSSVHLARELARIWGNLDYGVRELRRDDVKGESEILAHAWDQQTNTRSTRSFIVPHAKMKTLKGKQTRQPLVDLGDIYLNNQNIGARAVRECIFAVMPTDFVADAEDICRNTIEHGDGKPLVERIAAMVDAYRKLGVKVPQIEARLGRKRGQWTAADVADLGVLWSSINRRERSVDEEFAAPPVTLAEINGATPATHEPDPEPVAELAYEPADEDGWPETAQPPADPS